MSGMSEDSRERQDSGQPPAARLDSRDVTRCFMVFLGRLPTRAALEGAPLGDLRALLG